MIFDEAVQLASAKGKKLRFALMPISWLVAIVTVILLLNVLAVIASTSPRALLQDRSLWPLAFLFPAIVFGKVLGFMGTNWLAYSVPSLRQTFEDEVRETGRRGFFRAMKGLAVSAVIAGLITVGGAAAFLLARQT